MTYEDKSAELKAQSHRIYTFIKRILDFLVSLIALITITPLMVVIGILIKLDSPGPIFLKQNRIGYLGKPFDVIKFRTMYVGKQLDKQIEKSSTPHEMRGPVFKMGNDPRVTRVGRILRKYSLNELPQLFNVLRGDMSLVGPRPPLAYELAHYEDWHKRRLEVTPGLTGIWQIQPHPSNYDEMVKLDIWYIEHQSMWLDLKILLQTIPAAFRGYGAY